MEGRPQKHQGLGRGNKPLERITRQRAAEGAEKAILHA